MDHLMTTQQVATLAERHYQTVYGWYKSGALPAAFKIGDRLYFHPDVVAERIPVLLQNKPGRKRKAA